MYYIIRRSCKGWTESEKIEIIDAFETEKEALHKVADLAANLFGYMDYDEMRKDSSYNWWSSAFKNDGREFDWQYIEDEDRADEVSKAFSIYELLIVEFSK